MGGDAAVWSRVLSRVIAFSPFWVAGLVGLWWFWGGRPEAWGGNGDFVIGWGVLVVACVLLGFFVSIVLLGMLCDSCGRVAGRLESRFRGWLG